MKSLKPQSASTNVATESESSDRPRVLPGILIVHEEKLMRIMLKLGLHQHGFQVWTASNSLEATQLYRRHRNRLAVILLSHRVAGVEGHPALEALREIPTRTPICFLVDQSAEAPSMPGDRARAVHLLTEPFDMEEIRRVVKTLAQASSRTIQTN